MKEEMKESITELTEELTYLVMESGPNTPRAQAIIHQLSNVMPASLQANGLDEEEALLTVVGAYAGAQVDFFTANGVEMEEAERMAEVSARGIFGISLSLQTHKVH